MQILHLGWKFYICISIEVNINSAESITVQIEISVIAIFITEKRGKDFHGCQALNCTKKKHADDLCSCFPRLGNGTESDYNKIKGNLEVNSVCLHDTSRGECVNRTAQNKYRGSGVNTIADCLSTQVYEQQ